MRRIGLLFLILVMLVFLASCSSSAEDKRGRGTIRICLPSNNNDSSKSLTNSQAASVADSYVVEILTQNGGYAYGGRITPSENEIILPAGTYTVAVMAGVNQNDFISFCGSGYAESVVVEDKKTTSVEIELIVPSLEIEYLADDVTLYPNYTNDIQLFTIEFDSHNPYVFAYGSASIYDYTKHDESVITCNYNGNCNSAFTETVVVSNNKGPKSIGKYYYGFAGQLHMNVDYSYCIAPLGIEDYDAFFEPHEFEIVQYPSGMEITLSWKND